MPLEHSGGLDRVAGADREPRAEALDRDGVALPHLFTRMLVRRIVETEGYQCPEICSPEELLEVEG